MMPCFCGPPHLFRTPLRFTGDLGCRGVRRDCRKSCKRSSCCHHKVGHANRGTGCAAVTGANPPQDGGECGGPALRPSSADISKSNPAARVSAGRSSSPSSIPGSSGNGWRTASADNPPGAGPKRSEPQRMPRSPRAAIEPDRVDLPARRSASARHPLVVIGNAVILSLIHI